MDQANIIGQTCFIKHRNGTESFAGVAVEIVERGTTLVRFDKAKLLWPIDQVLVSESEEETEKKLRLADKKHGYAVVDWLQRPSPTPAE